ncbi:DoxX family protein [Mycolicibacterium sp. PDY-3]|uniref:DoxX family protein n=1 Tax=Mycolicibacterium sp. PDY-3 TaxID=3376069 RepID=UPI0037A7CD85
MREMSSIYVAVSVGYGLMCLVPAAMKLIGVAKMRDSAEHFGIRWSRYRLVGVLELAAAVAVFAGIVTPTLGLLAAIGMSALLIAAVVTHRRAGDGVREYSSALVFLIASVGYLAVWITAAPRP